MQTICPLCGRHADTYRRRHDLGLLVCVTCWLDEEAAGAEPELHP